MSGSPADGFEATVVQNGWRAESDPVDVLGSHRQHDKIGTNQYFDWGWIADNRDAGSLAVSVLAKVLAETMNASN